MTVLFALFCSCLITPHQNPPETLLAGWVEGESAKCSPAVFKSAGWGRSQDLADKKWLFAAVDAHAAAKLTQDERTISFDIRIPPGAGGVTAKVTRNIWVRIGYEFARSPFRWRIGDLPWKTVTPDELTSNLMAIDDFAEVAWLNLGAIELTPGGYKFEIEVQPKPKDRLLFGLDCLYLAEGEFRPNGPHRPGELWKYALDYEAEKTVFTFPTAPRETPSHVRNDLDLNGAWQIARYDEQEVTDRTKPIASLPADLEALFWRGITVPSDRNTALPEWAYCHRYLYRCKVEVPKTFAGRAFVLRFPNNALMTTVWVNGVRVGFSKTPCAAFECDISGAIRHGETNEIIVGIKDLHYAIAKTGDGRSPRYLFNFPPNRFYESGGLGPTKFADFPTLFKVRRHGILETPTLSVRGLAYTDDVFGMADVEKKTLTLRTTLKNPTAEALTVEVEHAIRPLVDEGKTTPGEPKRLPKTTHTITPTGEISFDQTEEWPNVRLWWPDDPFRYVVVTTISVKGKPIDERKTPFGFRQWGIRGREFTLNGIPWHFRADLRGNSPTPADQVPATLAEWRKNGQNMMRYWGEEPWTGTSQRDTLTTFDRAGVAVRRSGIFDGEVASYQLVIDGKVNTALFDNWREQLAAWVKAERNHPSIFIWSLENEITYINARNFGWLKEVEPEIKKTAALVQQLDPTRPVMIDGGDALLDQSLPVAGNHYLEKDHRDYPNEAYTLTKALTRHTQPRPWDPWPIPADKPFFLGESFFANGSPPAAYADLIGDAAFLGRREASRGVTRFARMLSEGYRTNGVAAFHFWFAEGADAEHYKAWQPVAVFTKEWNTAWPAGATFNRTLTVINDTRIGTPMTIYWLLQTKNTPNIMGLRGKQDIKLAPGTQGAIPITLQLPEVAAGETVEADWVVSVVREGKELFRDVKPVRLLGPVVPTPGLTVTTAAIFDPAKKLPTTLRATLNAKEFTSFDDIKQDFKLIIIGPDALSAEQALQPSLANLAARGARVVVFDQTHPLSFQGAPIDLETTSLSGRIAFPEDPTHPAFRGLTGDDFFCWSGDHICYRNAYRKPTRGCRSLLPCDVELGLTALLEIPVGTGVMLLNQTPLGAKPNDAAALRLAANLIQYAWTYQRSVKQTAAVLPTDDPRVAMLRRIGLKFTLVTDAVAALETAEIVVVDGQQEVLTALLEAIAKRTAFQARGGKIIVCNLQPTALEAFNKLVEVPHVLRNFRRERVTPSLLKSPLSAGLSIRDCALESAEKIYPWAGDRYPADDTFTTIVDLDDAAPFVSSEKFDFAWKQMTNGLTSADSWKFIFYHDHSKEGANPSWSAKFAKPETPTAIEVVLNTDYRAITKLRVVFDNNPARSVVLTLTPQRERLQVFPLNVTNPCSTIALEPLEWVEGSKPVSGIDNITIRVKRPDDFAAKVVPLLNIGALVDYPQAGVFLNQLRIEANEANPINADKKAALQAHILTRLGADLSGGRSTGVALNYRPVPFNEKCNAYLAAGKTRPNGVPDLATFPVGEQRFAGVPYEIRDVKTSPVPGAIMLAPKAAPVAVPVDATADALFFLHTFHPSWMPSDIEAKPIFEYVVTYTDGEKLTVPVLLGRQVDSLHTDAASSKSVVPVAWTGKNNEAKQQLAVYAFRWTNPRPTFPVRSVAIQHATQPPVNGVPIWLGLTLGTATTPPK